MKRIGQMVVVGVMSLGLTSTSVMAQSAYDRGRAPHANEVAAWHGDHGYRDGGYQGRDYGRGGYDTDRYDRGNYDARYYDRDYYYDRDDHHAGRTAAIIGASAAAGAVIGGVAGHGQGAAVGALVGGIAGFVADQAVRHHDGR